MFNSLDILEKYLLTIWVVLVCVSGDLCSILRKSRSADTSDGCRQSGRKSFSLQFRILGFVLKSPDGYLSILVIIEISSLLSKWRFTALFFSVCLTMGLESSYCISVGNGLACGLASEGYVKSDTISGVQIL